MHHEVLLLSLLFLFTTLTAATPSLWSINIDNDPTPPLSSVPPFSQHAIRDPSALKWQIPTLIISYLTFVLLTLTFILTIGRRLRLEAIDNRDARPMEMVKEPKRTFDPSPVSPRSAHSWRKIKGFVSGSPVDRFAPPSAAFDERVVRKDREEQSRALQKMYATVYEEEEWTKVGGETVEDDDGERLQRSENWQQLRHEESKESFAVSLPGRAWSAGIRDPSPPVQSQDDKHLPAELSSTPSVQAAEIQSSSAHRQPSPNRQDSRPQAHRLTSRSSRNLRALRITTCSNPSLTPTPTSALQHGALSSRGLTPLTPLRSHPTTPAPIQAQTIIAPSTSADTTNTTRLVPPHLHTGAEARTPGTVLTYISESAQDDDAGEGGEVDSPWPPQPPAHQEAGGGAAAVRTSMDPYLNRPLPPLPLDAQAGNQSQAQPQAQAHAQPQAQVQTQTHAQPQVQVQVQSQTQPRAQTHAQPSTQSPAPDLNRQLPPPPPTPHAANLELEHTHDTRDTTSHPTPTSATPQSELPPHPLRHPHPTLTSSFPSEPAMTTAHTTAIDLGESYTGLPATPRSPFFTRRGDREGGLLALPPTPRVAQTPAAQSLGARMQIQGQIHAQMQMQMDMPRQTQAQRVQQVQQPQHRARALPLRTFQPPAHPPLSDPHAQPPTSPNRASQAHHGLAPLRSPLGTAISTRIHSTRPTQLTLLSPLSSRFPRPGANGPPTAGLPTPYSPYMPHTPMTPVTPGLQTREERRRQQREGSGAGGGRNGGWGRSRRAMGQEDVVLDEGEMWGWGYEER